eukprot:COSAG04_NODE_201_length_20457_cov_316.186462_15_plen_320_part_00
MPAPVAVLVEVDGEPVFQAYIAYCAICRGPCPASHVVNQVSASAIAGGGGADSSRRGGARAAALCVGATGPPTLRCTTFAIFPAVKSSPSRNLIRSFQTFNPAVEPFPNPEQLGSPTISQLCGRSAVLIVERYAAGGGADAAARNRGQQSPCLSPAALRGHEGGGISGCEARERARSRKLLWAAASRKLLWAAADAALPAKVAGRWPLSARRPASSRPLRRRRCAAQPCRSATCQVRGADFSRAYACARPCMLIAAAPALRRALDLRERPDRCHGRAAAHGRGVRRRQRDARGAACGEQLAAAGERLPPRVARCLCPTR